MKDSSRATIAYIVGKAARKKTIIAQQYMIIKNQSILTCQEMLVVME